MAAVDVVELYPQVPQRSEEGGTAFTAYPDGTEIVELFDDGSVAASAAGGSGFNVNLAERMSASQRATYAGRLCEYAETDLDSRKEWDRLSAQGLRALGVERIPAERLPFVGAAAVQHPVLAEACVQFQANAIEEFFPATGPVQGAIAGDATPEIEAQVERASDFMNYYLTAVDEGYYADTDQMLFYLPVAGSVFRKVEPDPRTQNPVARYVKAEDFIAPYFARELKHCPRYAHTYPLTGAEIRRAMRSGRFIDLTLPHPALADEVTAGRKIEDASDRRQPVLHSDDELYEILEYHIEGSLPEGVDELDTGEIDLPYVVYVDKTSREILGVYRNWKEGDPTFEKRVWFAHYRFLPGLGFYGWGFVHVLGSLADAASGGIRATLDSALMATVQGGFRAKDGVKKAGSVEIEPGKWKDIDATSDELARTFFTPPFREPSGALPALVTGLVSDARRFASITEVVVGQADNRGPVGTTIALIEQSMKVFTAIHKRIYATARQEFRMLAELFYEYGATHEYPYHLKGEARVALREDFDDRVDFLPVADPNIISSVQRIAIAQAQIELMNTSPDLYTIEQRAEAHRRLLRALKVPDPEKVEPSPPQPIRIDAVGENAALLTGRAIRAFPGQAHDLHRMIHERGYADAQNTMTPDEFRVYSAAMLSHIREHDALEMLEQVSANMQASIGVPMPPVDYYAEGGEDMDPDLEMAITIAASQALPPPRAPGALAQGQGDPAAAKAAEDQRALTEARDAESVAKIERQTAEFAAREKREQQAFERKQARMDDETVAAILRRGAQANLDQRNRAQQMAQSLNRLTVARPKAGRKK